VSDLETRDAAVVSANDDGTAGGFIWYELMSPDPVASKAFYDAVLGWDIESQPSGGQEIDYRMIRRSDGGNAGGVLRLSADMQANGGRPSWLGYIHVEDVDSVAAETQAAGGRICMPPTDIPGVGRIAMLSDPQGAAFYVMKPVPPEGSPDAKSDVFSEREVQRCGWNELSTSNVDAARQFYGDRFGWRSDDFMPMGEMGEYRFIHQGETRIGAMFNPGPDEQPRWRFYFRVPSVAAAKEAIEKSGGKIAAGPMEVPGGDYVVIGFDPQGAEFALVGGA
jgi:predicted enzyme related to lactoylglutathione lyase